MGWMIAYVACMVILLVACANYFVKQTNRTLWCIVASTTLVLALILATSIALH